MAYKRVHLDEKYSLKVADSMDNFDTLFDLIKEGVDNCGEPDVDMEHLWDTASQYYNGPMTERVLIVLYREERPIGVLLGAKAEFHPVFRKTGITVEQLWWVTPEYRGSKHGTKLIEAFEEWSRSIGAKRCVMSHFNDPIGAKLKKFYEKNNYKLSEESYVKVLS